MGPIKYLQQITDPTTGKMSQQHAKSSGLLGRSILDGRKVEVPLVGVKVSGEVHDFIAEVKVQQCFLNSENFDLEGVYHFPLDEASAVCAFQADYEDGTVVEGIVKEKEEARKEYETAVKSGKQAQLLESVRPDIFTLTVGRLPPGGHVSITITYITMLKAEGSAARFLLPTHIGERYSPAHSHPQISGQLLGASGPSLPTCTAKFFGLDVTVKFRTHSPIKTLASPTHQGDIAVACSGTCGEATMRNVSLTKDLVILCEESNPHQPRACLEIDKDGGVAGLVTLFPEIEFKDVPREIIFVIDRSGSMGALVSKGKTQMDEAREALQLFLRSLPPSCTFNLVGFGTRFESLFPTPQQYDDTSLAAASEYVRTMKSDFGGTAILKPLQHILGSMPPAGSGQRQVFVLTDGQVSNEGEVFNLVRHECASGAARVFALGVGANVSHHLVEGMARAGKGTAMFVAGGSTEIRTKVLTQLKQALQPSLTNTSVTWNFPPQTPADPAPTPAPAPVLVKTLLGYRSPDVDTPAQKAIPMPRVFPSTTPPILNKERFVSFALFPKGEMELPESVTVKAETPDGPLEVTLPLGEEELVRGTVAHRLAAKLGIQECEEGLKCGGVSEPEALALALAHGLASKQTSFVAVRTQRTSSTDAAMTRTVIPQQQPEPSHKYFSNTQICPWAMDAMDMAAPRADRRAAKGMYRMCSLDVKSASLCAPSRKSAPAMKSAAAAVGAVGAMLQSSVQGLLGGGGGGRGDASCRERCVPSAPQQGQQRCATPAATLSVCKKKEKKRGKSAQAECSERKEEAMMCDVFPAEDEDEDEACSMPLESAVARSTPQAQARTRSSGQHAEDTPVARAAASSEEDMVMLLCMLQRADGSFPLEALAAWMGVTPTNLEAVFVNSGAAALAVVRAGEADSSTIATVAAVVLLRGVYAEHRAVWELQEGKAVHVLAGRGVRAEELEGCVASLKGSLADLLAKTLAKNVTG